MDYSRAFFGPTGADFAPCRARHCAPVSRSRSLKVTSLPDRFAAQWRSLRGISGGVEYPGVEEALAAQAQGAWENILERAGKTLGRELCDAFAGAPLAQQLPRVLACSPFVAEQARRKPALLLELAGANPFKSRAFANGARTSSDFSGRSRLHRYWIDPDLKAWRLPPTCL